jgi:hypothetical protein
MSSCEKRKGIKVNSSLQRCLKNGLHCGDG